MSISIRTVKGRKYAYEVQREGKRWIQTYLGPASDPKVVSMIAEERAAGKIPGSVRALFWETDPSKLDPSRHGSAIIRKVLEIGDLASLEWTLRRFGIARVERAVRAGRGLSPRSQEFFRVWFGMSGADA